MFESIKKFFESDKGFDVQSGTVKGHAIGLAGAVICIVSCSLPFIMVRDIVGYYYEFDSCITLILMIIAALLIFYNKYKYTLVVTILAALNVICTWVNTNTGIVTVFNSRADRHMVFYEPNIRPEYGVNLFILGFALIFIDFFLHIKTKKEN